MLESRGNEPLSEGSPPGERLRILLLVHSLRRGGAERVVLELALGLQARGHAVLVLGLLDANEYCEERYRRVPTASLLTAGSYHWPFSLPVLAGRLARQVVAFRPGVIQIHTPTAAIAAALARTGLPTVHVYHGYGDLTRPASFKAFVRRRLERWSAKTLRSQAVAVSPAMRGAIAKHLGCQEDAVLTVLNGIDLERFTPAVREFVGAPVIAVVGTLCEVKRTDQALFAFQSLLRRWPGARLLIVGEGPLRPRLEALIDELSLRGAVHLLGRRSDVPEILAEAHLLWQLSQSEGLPLAVVEALACGVPVVGTNVRGVRDVVEDGVTGFLVPLGETEAVVDRSTQLLSQPKLCAAFSRAAEAAASRFSGEQMIENHERVLRAARGAASEVKLATIGKTSSFDARRIKYFAREALSPAGPLDLLRFARHLLLIRRDPAWSRLKSEIASVRGLLTIGDELNALKYLDVELWLARNVRRCLDLRLDRSAPLAVLDIGTGSGLFPFVCNMMGHQAHGMDQTPPNYNDSEGMVYQLIPRALGLRVINWDIRGYRPFQLEGSYDLITAFLICFNAHKQPGEWGRGEWEFFLDDICKRLNPGGRLHLSLNVNPERYGELQFYDRPTLELFRERGVITAPGVVEIVQGS